MDTKISLHEMLLLQIIVEIFAEWLHMNVDSPTNRHNQENLVNTKNQCSLIFFCTTVFRFL